VRVRLATARRTSPWQTFDALDAAGHVIAQVFHGLVGKDLAKVCRRHPPALCAGALLWLPISLQVVLANLVDVHGRSMPVFSLLLNVRMAKSALVVLLAVG
jgi:hypothetical protein